MKQIKLAEENTPSDSKQERKSSKNSRLKQKRQDRKRRLAVTKVQPKESVDISSSDERKEMRKMRNRDAAQRARDKAKKKMEQLCDEVEELRMENQMLRKRMVIMCLKCKQEVVVKEEEPYSTPTTNVTVENGDGMKPRENYECKFQRVAGLPPFQYPFFFGLLTIVACFILILSAPCEDQYTAELRILESILEKNWKQNSLTREINENSQQDYISLDFKPSGFRRGEYEYYKQNVGHLKPSGRISSIIIEIQQQQQEELRQNDLVTNANELEV